MSSPRDRRVGWTRQHSSSSVEDIAINDCSSNWSNAAAIPLRRFLFGSGGLHFVGFLSLYHLGLIQLAAVECDAHRHEHIVLLIHSLHDIVGRLVEGEIPALIICRTRLRRALRQSEIQTLHE